VFLRLAKEPDRLLIICDRDREELRGLYAGIETARRTVSRCQIRAGAFERRLCDGMSNALGEGESHAAAICRGEARRAVRQCTGRGDDDADGVLVARGRLGVNNNWEEEHSQGMR